MEGRRLTVLRSHELSWPEVETGEGSLHAWEPPDPAPAPEACLLKKERATRDRYDHQ